MTENRPIFQRSKEVGEGEKITGEAGTDQVSGDEALNDTLHQH